MTLQANGVDVGQVEEFGIFATMRRMTGRAARLFDGSVFVHPWASEVSVALQTRGNLLRNASLEARLKGIVRIVTSGAPCRAIINLVVDRRGKLRFNRRVALIAKGRLQGLQQLLLLARMDGMATGATDVGRRVCRTRKVWMLCGVAAETACVCLFG